MYYASYKCKFCEKKVKEAYPPSITIVGTVKDEGGNEVIDEQGRGSLRMHHDYLADLCTDCFNKVYEESEKAKLQGETVYQDFCNGVIINIKKFYPEWDAYYVAFVDSMFGSGCPSMLVFVNNPFKEKE